MARRHVAISSYFAASDKPSASPLGSCSTPAARAGRVSARQSLTARDRRPAKDRCAFIIVCVPDGRDGTTHHLPLFSELQVTDWPNWPAEMWNPSHNSIISSFFFFFFFFFCSLSHHLYRRTALEGKRRRAHARTTSITPVLVLISDECLNLPLGGLRLGFFDIIDTTRYPTKSVADC
ncbi:hypothetical protein GGR53DRAFT_196018 [Hypoxylon sp. FL1150]|nr:hypothetical protein GGR53DRAFT_196018 [Hypoxylon sp. FL1150]